MPSDFQTAARQRGKDGAKIITVDEEPLFWTDDGEA